MKNADMPAMPIIDDEKAFPLDMEKHGSESMHQKFATGMTKRETVVMNFMAALIGKAGTHYDPSLVAEGAFKLADAYFARLEAWGAS